MVFVKVLLLGLSTLSTVWTQDPLLPTINILTEVAELKAAVAQLRQEVKRLQEDQPNIAFTAFLEAPGPRGHTGPFPNDITLVFKHVQTSVGGGFDPTTGTTVTANQRAIFSHVTPVAYRIQMEGSE
ncbi:hypothetical protein NFI96_021605 [Prochilodus magdalenae]|nr:hypothetical protein NFI96_021605 [Prochilodus magdalenae]